MMFKWQKHSQGEKDVSQYDKLVESLEMRAIAAELCTRETTRCSGSSKTMVFLTKGDNLSKGGTSYSEASTNKMTSTTHGGISCPICKVNKHSLYYCPRFKALPTDRRLIVARKSNACFNCLSTVHIPVQCLLAPRPRFTRVCLSVLIMLIITLTITRYTLVCASNVLIKAEQILRAYEAKRISRAYD